MSRGLGRSQRALLRALADLDREMGEGWYYVWAVLERAWIDNFRDEYERARQERESADAKEQEETQRLAKAGDENALKRLALQKRINMLADILRHPSRNAPQARRQNAGDIESMVNPSRVFALLQKRGLIDRRPYQGGGACVRLTPLGRAQASALESAGVIFIDQNGDGPGVRLRGKE